MTQIRCRGLVKTTAQREVGDSYMGVLGEEEGVTSLFSCTSSGDTGIHSSAAEKGVGDRCERKHRQRTA